MAKKQTAGRDNLGALAPQFAALNDDVLFGQVWAREEQLSPGTGASSPLRRCFPRGCIPS